MKLREPTQVIPLPTWSDPRIHLLDDTWLLTIFGCLLATGIPWLVSAFDMHFAAASLGLLGLGAIHIAFTLLGRPSIAGERRAVLVTLHVVGVVILGFIWLQAGGLQNPAFLLVFALPVVGAIFLSRWQPYFMALAAILVVAAVALAQTPELRWFVPGLNAVGVWLGTTFAQQGTTPFPGFYAPSGYYLVLLQVFAIMTIACAFAAEYLGAIFERLHSHVDLARVEAERGQEFWATLIEELPLPALLVDADTLQILCASKGAAAFCSSDEVTGRDLLQTVRFSYPEIIQDLVTGMGGAAPLSMIHVGDRLRATEAQVRHLVQKGRRFALLIIQDKTDELTLKAALDVSGQAVLIIDGQARILAYNKPALALFSGVEKETDAARLLSLTGMPGRWWEPGLTGRRKMHVEIAPRVFQVTTSACPLPGEEEQIFVVMFLPVARAVSGEQTGIMATAQIVDATNDTLSTRASGMPR